MAKIVWTRPALEDLRRIDRYLTKEADHRTAASVLSTVRFRLKTLEDFPHAGPPVEGRPYRSYVIRGTPYVVAYRVRAGEVQLLRLHHQRENWQLPID